MAEPATILESILGSPMVPLDPAVAKLVVGSAVVALGALLQGSVGYGLALLPAPLLALIDPRFIPGPLLFAALALTVLMTIRERASIDRRVAWALVGRVPGTVAGAATLALLAADALGVVLGLLVVLAVGMTAIGPPIRPTVTALLLAGTLSGFMGTTASIGGPPLALLYQRESGPRVRATLSSYFTIGAVMSLCALAVVGRFGWWELRAALGLVPGMLIGFVLSSRTTAWLDGGRTRVAVLVVAACAGAALVLRELF